MGKRTSTRWLPRWARDLGRLIDTLWTDLSTPNPERGEPEPVLVPVRVRNR